MDRDRCIYFLKRFYGLEEPPLGAEEVKEILTDYVCDRGHCDKKEYIPALMQVAIWENLLNYAFDYYRTFFEINTVEKVIGPSTMPITQIIFIY